MSTDPTATPGTTPPSDKTREILIGRLRGAHIKPGEQRDRFSDIIKRWNSDADRASVTEDELRKLLNEVSPPRDDPQASS
jgi:hypothetical protein